MQGYIKFNLVYLVFSSGEGSTAEWLHSYRVHLARNLSYLEQPCRGSTALRVMRAECLSRLSARPPPSLSVDVKLKGKGGPEFLHLLLLLTESRADTRVSRRSPQRAWETPKEGKACSQGGHLGCRFESVSAYLTNDTEIRARNGGQRRQATTSCFRGWNGGENRLKDWMDFIWLDGFLVPASLLLLLALLNSHMYRCCLLSETSFLASLKLNTLNQSFSAGGSLSCFDWRHSFFWQFPFFGGLLFCRTCGIHVSDWLIETFISSRRQFWKHHTIKFTYIRKIVRKSFAYFSQPFSIHNKFILHAYIHIHIYINKTDTPTRMYTLSKPYSFTCTYTTIILQ